MAFDLMVLSSSLTEKQAVADILSLNTLTECYALTLTPRQAAQLARTRYSSLKSAGRVEFGGGVIEKIIKSFYDSPYLSQNDYEETLCVLIELFYYFKNETLDLLGDDDLIRLMKKGFESCRGALDLLANRDLETMARNVRCGLDPEYRECDEEDLKELDDDEY